MRTRRLTALVAIGRIRLAYVSTIDCLREAASYFAVWFMLTLDMTSKDIAADKASMSY
jgi:hypothetical protein